MTTLRTAAQQALEALRHVVRQAQENLVPTIHYGPVHDAMNRLEAALAEPVQEPQGCDHCNHWLYAGIKCRMCGRVTEPTTEDSSAVEPVQEPFALPCPTPKACKAHCCSGQCIPRAALAEPEPPPEAQTEAEKMAYCAGWWAALEKARKAEPQEPDSPERRCGGPGCDMRCCQPVQEPVAWRTFDGEGGYDYRTYEDNEDYAAEWAKRNPRHVGWAEPLYTAPPQRPAEPVQEPVAWRYWKDKFACWEYSDTQLEFPAVPAGTKMYPLYAAQPRPTPLTEEEIDSIWDSEKAFADIYAITRAIERAHSIKE